MRKLLHSKKGADPNQLFIYIAAIVIVGFVFLYGFKAVATFLKSSEDIELAKFVKDFQGKASSVSTDFGSVQFLTIDIPSKFSRVCITDPYRKDPVVECDPFTTDHDAITREICDEWSDLYSEKDVASASRTFEPTNVYFIDDKDRIGYKDYIADIQPDQPFICSRDGKIRLEGLARVALVSLE